IAPADRGESADEVDVGVLEHARGAYRLPSRQRSQTLENDVREPRRSPLSNDNEVRRRKRWVSEEDVVLHELLRWRHLNPVRAAKCTFSAGYERNAAARTVWI